jgi:hypothetical protein
MPKEMPDTKSGGMKTKRLMSVVSSAKRVCFDVWNYLKDILNRSLAGEPNYAKLMLDVWKQEHQDAILVYR